jgi:hypothetical protein
MEPTTEKKSSYSASHRAYYEKNKDKVREYQREKKPYKTYYEKHKEELNAKRLARYYAAKAAKAPASPVPTPDPAPDAPAPELV